MGEPSSDENLPIIIAGAGPVGMLVALSLGQAGIPTVVLESHPTLLQTTRAVVYMPVVIPVLKKLGIFDLVRENAYLNRQGVVWRDVQGNMLARLQLGDDQGDFEGVLLIGQAKMNALILEELKKYPSVQVRFGLRCVGIEDSPEQTHVKVMVHTAGHTDTDVILRGRYLIGTDGANSAVRRMLCIPFEGFTYQQWTLIGCDVIYDFDGEMDFSPLNFVVDPDDFCVIAYTGQDEGGRPHGSGAPQWRMAYPEPPDLPMSKDEVMKRAEKRVPRWLKDGSVDASKFRVIRAEPYMLHQRVAAQGRKGRVLLAGDALHSNNPMGGLGLTGGILDAFAYGNAIVRVVKRGEPDELLTQCAKSRRQVWIDVTNHLSQGNLKRMYGFDPETAAAREAFFKKLTEEPDFHRMVRASFDKMLPETFESTQAWWGIE